MPGRHLLREVHLILPLTLFFVVFVFGPLALLAFISLFQDSLFSTVGLTQYAKFLGDSFNLSVLWSTLWIALQTTVFAALLGYPLAYAYTLARPAVQRILIFLIVLPLLTSAVVRTLAWVVILGHEGVVNNLLLQIGLIEAPFRLLYTPGAIVVALVQIEMPLMVLPLITSLLSIEPNLKETSEVLGARKWRTFFAVTLPLSVPGLLAGCMLVFASSASAFVVHTLVGGGQNMLMPYYIYQQAIAMNNYPFAAAIATILLVSVLVMVTGMNIIGRRSRGFIHG